MAKKVLLLVNPYAGKAELKNRLFEIVDIFVKNDYEVSVHTTQKPLEIPSVVKKSGSGFDLIVACGGDGTLNETINGIMSIEKRPLLGYIPAGTVNDFAKSLDIPVSITGAAQLIIEKDETTIDVGIFNGRYFSYVAAFGAFSSVSYATAQNRKNILGRTAYLIEGLKSLPFIKPIKTTYTIDNNSYEDELIFGMITNSCSVGGFQFLNFSDVSLNDGLLEVTLVKKPKSFIEGQQIVSSMITQDLDSNAIITLTTDKINFSFASPIAWTVDGEYADTVLNADIEIKKRALRMITGFKKE